MFQMTGYVNSACVGKASFLRIHVLETLKTEVIGLQSGLCEQCSVITLFQVVASTAGFIQDLSGLAGCNLRQSTACFFHLPL